MFDVVLDLNRNRLLGRFGSSKNCAPSHRHEAKAPRLPIELEDLLRGSPLTLRSRHTDDYTRLLADVEVLRRKFLNFESVSDDRKLFRELVLQVYKITGDGVSLQPRLQRLGFSFEVQQHKLVRQLLKIANYWRACHELPRIAREYRTMFSDIRIEPVQHYMPAYFGDQPRHVHAEVQMIVHYELNPTQYMPRVLGASKEACFLCDACIRAHGRFFVSRAHETLFEKWAIPDLAEYSTETLDRFRNVVQRINADVKREHTRHLKGKRFRHPFPPQSFVNLNPANIRTPSEASRMSSVTGNHYDSNDLGRLAVPNLQLVRLKQRVLSSKNSRNQSPSTRSSRQRPPSVLLSLHSHSAHSSPEAHSAPRSLRQATRPRPRSEESTTPPTIRGSHIPTSQKGYPVMPFGREISAPSSLSASPSQASFREHPRLLLSEKHSALPSVQEQSTRDTHGEKKDIRIKAARMSSSGRTLPEKTHKQRRHQASRRPDALEERSKWFRVPDVVCMASCFFKIFTCV